MMISFLCKQFYANNTSTSCVFKSQLLYKNSGPGLKVDVAEKLKSWMRECEILSQRYKDELEERLTASQTSSASSAKL